MRVWGIGLGLLLFVTLISLSGCTLDNIAAQQGEATELWGELIGGDALGQSFISTRDNLYRIDLGTATFARANSAPVIFHLQSGPLASADIVSATLPGPEIQNERPTVIEFTPLTDSMDKTYYFYIESPEAEPGNAITVYANGYDQYAGGSAYRNGRAVAGDLVFTAYSRETFSFSGVLHELLSQVVRDVSFLVWWGLLTLGVCAGFVACSLRGLPSEMSGDSAHGAKIGAQKG